MKGVFVGMMFVEGDVRWMVTGRIDGVWVRVKVAFEKPAGV